MSIFNKSKDDKEEREVTEATVNIGDGREKRK